MNSTVETLSHAHPKPHSNPPNRSPNTDSRDASLQPSRYAFLNHSTDTVNQNLPPAVDDKPLARQRRRRTSPEDQSILEAAYNRDPKPDKAARLEIVEQVSLGEKEVQIWFQNRRQTSRRKSRPLLPHEIAQYQLTRSGGAPYLSSDPTTIPSQEDDVQASAEALTDLEHQNDIRETLSKELDSSKDTQTLSGSDLSIHEASRDGSKSDLPEMNEIEATTLPLIKPLDQPTGQLGHITTQDIAEPLRRSQSFNKPSMPPMHATSVESAPRLKKSSSLVRLSLTGEGNAKVVTKDSCSPSPPHASQGPPPGLQDNGSHHPANPSNHIPIFPPMRPLQRTSSGRSRDSRVWEFWCDKDARSELEEKAEQDASGSAAGAIGLLRSASGRNILGSIPSKRNSTMSRQSISLKRSKVDSAVPKLHKSSTAFARLEGMPISNTATYAPPPSKLSHAESSFSVYIPGNESDKENWSPCTDMSHNGPSEHSLQSISHMSKHVARQFSANELKRQRASFSNIENCRLEEDPEVAAFMRGTRRRRSVSGDEELDCVQGLLSLSQGNWR